MIYQESKSVRRVVGRLEEGEECIDRLSEFCREHDVRAAEIRAVGRLSRVEVVQFDPDAGEYATVFAGEGNFDLLNLSGNVSRLGDEVVLRCESLLAAQGPVQPQLITGQIRSGRVLEFEFVLEIFADLELERQLDGETGLLELKAVRKRPDAGDASETAEDAPNDALEGQSMSWDDAAEASEGARTSERKTVSDREGEQQQDSGPDAPEDIYGDMDLEEPVLEAGDVIDHPKLGRCRVIKVEDDKYAHIRLPQGKIRKLSLNVVEIEYVGEEDGQNVFEAKVGA